MSETNIYAKLATHILKGQIAVIGPLAVDQAKKVSGVLVDANNAIIIKGDGKDTLNSLVKQFERLFGKASIEVCKDAIKESQLSVSKDDLPAILQ